MGTVLLPLVATLATLACGVARADVKTSTDSVSEVVVQLGKESFMQYCAACHGADARGAGPVSATLKTAPPDLTTIATRHGRAFDARELASFIDGRSMPAVHGTREMPVWGRRFSADMGGGEVGEEAVRGQILILVEYLKAIQR